VDGCASSSTQEQDSPPKPAPGAASAPSVTSTDAISAPPAAVQDSFRFYIADPRTDSILLFWKDPATGKPYGSLGAVRRAVEAGSSRSLCMAMNGGMYTEDQGPLGLFVERGKVRSAVNRATGLHGNFYLAPNGIFFLTRKGRAGVCRTADYAKQRGVWWATQSGPMLVVDDRIHPKFTRGSANVNIRNGVGILPDGRVLFGISTVPVSFWDFAEAFRQQGCKNALYLDGAVSRMWCPAVGTWDKGGAFGVIIAVVRRGECE